MKKLLITLSMMALIPSFVFSQEPSFTIEDKVVNIGIGLGSTLYSGAYYKGTFPPVSVSFEKGIVDGVLEQGVIGVGGYLGYNAYKYEYLNWGWKYTNLMLGVRGSFHYPLVDKLDTYTGLMLGYQILSSKEFGTMSGINYNASHGGVLWAWYAGGRYYFSDKIGAMAEIGYGITYLNLGIALKL